MALRPTKTATNKSSYATTGRSLVKRQSGTIGQRRDSSKPARASQGRSGAHRVNTKKEHVSRSGLSRSVESRNRPAGASKGQGSWARQQNRGLIREGSRHSASKRQIVSSIKRKDPNPGKGNKLVGPQKVSPSRRSAGSKSKIIKRPDIRQSSGRRSHGSRGKPQQAAIPADCRGGDKMNKDLASNVLGVKNKEALKPHVG